MVDSEEQTHLRHHFTSTITTSSRLNAQSTSDQQKEMVVPLPASALPRPWSETYSRKTLPTQEPADGRMLSSGYPDGSSERTRMTVPRPDVAERRVLNAGSTKPLSVASLLSPMPIQPPCQSSSATCREALGTRGKHVYIGSQVPPCRPDLAPESHGGDRAAYRTGPYSLLANAYHHEQRYQFDQYHDLSDSSSVQKSPVPKSHTLHTTKERSFNNGRHPALSSVSSSAAPQFDLPSLFNYNLSIRQQPVAARACGFGDRDRRVIDPPPILELQITSRETGYPAKDVYGDFALHCVLMDESGHLEESELRNDDMLSARRLTGTLVASPHNTQDEYGIGGRFFLFHDLSCRSAGRYRLRFRLMRIDKTKMRPGVRFPAVGTATTNVFTVYSAKEFPGMRASSDLLKALRAQGVVVGVKKGSDHAHVERWKKRGQRDCSGEDSGEEREDKNGNESDDQDAIASYSLRKGKARGKGDLSTRYAKRRHME